MALFKILKGDGKANLNKYITDGNGRDGYCYFDKDESKLYIQIRDYDQETDAGTIEGCCKVLNAGKADNATLLDGKSTSDFAPSGFGLGATAKLISEQNLLDILPLAQSGWYHGEKVEGSPNYPNWCYFEIIADSSQWSSIHAYDFNGNVWRANYTTNTETNKSYITTWIGENIATYTNLEQIGLSDSDMVAKDENSLAENLTKIAYSCPNRGFIFILKNTDNFTKSLRDRLNYEFSTT